MQINVDLDDNNTEVNVERDDNNVTANESTENSLSAKPTPAPRNKPVHQQAAQDSEQHLSESMSPSDDQPSVSPEIQSSFESQMPQRVLDTQGLLISPHTPVATNAQPAPPTQESIDLTQEDDSRNEEHSEMETEPSPPHEENNVKQQQPPGKPPLGRRKPAPILAALVSLGRRPTRPTLVTSSEKNAEPEEGDTSTAVLKRKKDGLLGKKSKKGKKYTS